MNQKNLLSVTNLLAAAKSVLSAHNYSEVTEFDLDKIALSNQCLFEDGYGLVAIVGFETWGALFSEWSSAQASFVELISEHISREEKKSWDCYLLLWTPDFIPFEKTEDLQNIRYDTGRVRKLVASAEVFRSLSDVETALLPLLPIDEDLAASPQQNILDQIPELLSSGIVSEEMIRTAVTAFEQGRSMFEAINDYKVQK